MSVLLPFMVVLPLGAGFILALLPRRHSGLSNFIVILVSFFLPVKAFLLFGYRGVYEVGGWASPIGISLMLDAFSWLMLAVISLVSCAVLLYSIKYMQMYTSNIRYYVLFMMMLAGINGTLLAADIFNRFVYIELAAIASYILVAFGCGFRELSASFKYVVLGTVASSVTLLGIAILYGLYGTVSIGHLGESISGAGFSSFGALFLAFVLMLVGFGFKAALMPFHVWQPDVLDNAPAPVAAIISGTLISSIGMYALLRTVFAVFGISIELGWALLILGVISSFGGALVAFFKKSYKLRLSYWGISQMGYVLWGVGFGGLLVARYQSHPAAALAVIGGIYHLLNYSIFKPLLFLEAGVSEYVWWRRGSSEDPKKRNSLAKMVGMFSLAGIPPLGGAISKIMIIAACFLANYFILGFAAVAAALITFFVLYRKRDLSFVEKKEVGRLALPPLIRFPIALLVFLIFALSFLVLPWPRAKVLEPAYENILDYSFGKEVFELNEK